jgi:RNase adapter protein RapZ
VDDLKEYTGEDDRVSDFVLKSEAGEGFMSRFSELVGYLIPGYISEGKSYLTIGVGCTGGRHRSVAAVEELVKRLPSGEYDIKIQHRDKNRG